MRTRGRIAAGDLRERITFQTRAAGADNLGKPIGAWGNAIAGVPAKAEPIRGREFFAQGQMQAEVTVRFVIRYRADVTEKMRIVWRGLPYEIVSPPIDTDGAREQLELMCAHGVRDGR
jgi:SPP1 family predicted phage head-tail adaptor